MLKLLDRLFRREKRIDDAMTAYIEGRPSGDALRMVRERFVSSPGEQADLESLKDTVNLLRSVEPVSAPRSFALRDAPAQVTSNRTRFLQVPAFAAAAAAIALGILVAGDVTGALRQSGSATSGPATEAATGLAAAQSESATMKAQPTGFAAPLIETVVVSSDRPAPLIPAPAGLLATAPEATPDAVDAGFAPSALEGSGRTGPEAADVSADVTPEMPIRGSTVSAPPVEDTAGGPGGQPERDSTPAQEDREGTGLSLPLRQAEIALGAAALLMTAGWLAFRRRNRAGA